MLAQCFHITGLMEDSFYQLAQFDTFLVKEAEKFLSDSNYWPKLRNNNPENVSIALAKVAKVWALCANKHDDALRCLTLAERLTRIIKWKFGFGIAITFKEILEAYMLIGNDSRALRLLNECHNIEIIDQTHRYNKSLQLVSIYGITFGETGKAADLLRQSELEMRYCPDHHAYNAWKRLIEAWANILADDGEVNRLLRTYESMLGYPTSATMYAWLGLNYGDAERCINLARKEAINDVGFQFGLDCADVLYYVFGDEAGAADWTCKAEMAATNENEIKEVAKAWQRMRYLSDFNRCEKKAKQTAT